VTDRAPEPWVEFEADAEHVQREREKARALRGNNFPARDLTMDHVVPVARGGRSVKGNVVASCKPCNTAKKLLTPAERLLLAREHSDREEPD